MTAQAPILGLTRRWNLARPVEVSPRLSRPHALVERILLARGLSDPDAAEAFLNPSLHHLHDPSLIPDLDLAAQHILHTLRNRQPIAIYADYDVDGLTAAAILFRTLRMLHPHADVRTYIPHRIDEGYGLNADAIRSLADDGTRLVITVDCGVTAVEPARTAHDAGLELIITDHHTPPASIERLPRALAVVHPTRPDSEYPYPHLCGAGVAYKLAWRLATIHSGAERATPDLRTHLVEMLALAALGTVADVVPLTAENRAIARFGLSRVRSSPIVGLRALVDAAGLAGNRIDEYHAGFAIAPRLNAAGRVGHARHALDLLITDDRSLADRLALDLCRLNNERREVERRITEQAVQLAIQAGMTTPDRRAIVLAHQDWHAGVVGIVCSRLVERFARPVILLSRSDDALAGSARSVEGFSLHDALARCDEHLISHGGHDMAAGLKLRPDHLHAFTDAFIAIANERLTPDDLVTPIAIDCDASLRELTTDAVHAIDRLAPFGRGNPPVRLLVRDAEVVGRPALLGREGKHLALHLRQGGTILRCIAWNWGCHFERIPPGARIDAVLSPRLTTWGGRTRVEPEVRDLRVLSG